MNMDDLHLAPMELLFAGLIWENAPLTSGQLVKLCQKELEWKKSTTYTVLKKLCDRGIFRNDNSIITPLLTREEFHARQSEKFVEETFAGSLPAFIAAFTRQKHLSRQEIAEIRTMIDDYEASHHE